MVKVPPTFEIVPSTGPSNILSLITGAVKEISLNTKDASPYSSSIGIVIGSGTSVTANALTPPANNKDAMNVLPRTIFFIFKTSL
ncbi:hypothetical protein ENLAB_03410 [Enterococcus innesii]|uniref:Uncharacterized protein n=1 Tax=Enterococcus innesii TaxID=2839759 RepID=A0ABM7XP20_9ENTE|nr:hypothetical protein ENLAB_03410 [Enterococcus innesii]